MLHWQREVLQFEGHLAQCAGNSYRTWQPTKWQSLLSVRDLLAEMCWGGHPADGGSALELGCGSATLLIQLQELGVRTRGVDRDPGARKLAALAASSLGAHCPELIDENFFEEGFLARTEPADLVFHIGVIEHFERERQLDFLRLSSQLSRRWILVAVPNMGGAVFDGFIRAVTKQGAVYDDEHQDIDIQDLADELGYAVVRKDGAHLFYSNPSFYSPETPRLSELYGGLRRDLIARGGERYKEFPLMAFSEDDIPVLKDVEDGAGRALRYAEAFLQYFLLDTRP